MQCANNALLTAMTDKPHRYTQMFMRMDTITARQLAVLLNIYQYPNRSTNFHVKLLKLTPPVVTRACDVLEYEYDAIRRPKDAYDGRKVTMYVMPNGIEMLRHIVGRRIINDMMKVPNNNGR